MKQQKEWHQLKQDAVLIGDWEEIQKKPLSTITGNDQDTEILDGLIVKGYEMKFDKKTNTNGERYEKGAIDKFIQDYFVDKKLNMPVDVEHDYRPEWLCGRVVYIEENSVGVYYVAYIPKGVLNYDDIKLKLSQKILQGFSKFGWATDWEWEKDPETGEEYEIVKEINIVRMSIVATPANGISFEKIQEIKNATRFNRVNDSDTDTDKKPETKSAFGRMFK